MVIFIAFAVLFRIATLVVSVRHERRLVAEGAVEIGAGNSRALALAHAAVYLAAIAEYFLSSAYTLDTIAMAGLALYAFGATMLIIVIATLGRLWTVKLYIASDHVLVKSPLFRWFRHPNYFLNILPELIGFTLALHAFAALIIGLPLYLVPLRIRISQEEAAMRAKFASY
jgi:isoprenylcysteine carboxyl methyltransferase (ICMT) family protein YpbQ